MNYFIKSVENIIKEIKDKFEKMENEINLYKYILFYLIKIQL